MSMELNCLDGEKGIVIPEKKRIIVNKIAHFFCYRYSRTYSASLVQGHSRRVWDKRELAWKLGYLVCSKLKNKLATCSFCLGRNVLQIIYIQQSKWDRIWWQITLLSIIEAEREEKHFSRNPAHRLLARMARLIEYKGQQWTYVWPNKAVADFFLLPWTSMLDDRLPANLSSHGRITQIAFSFIKSSVISKLNIRWGRGTLDADAYFRIHCLHQCYVKPQFFKSKIPRKRYKSAK